MEKTKQGFIETIGAWAKKDMEVKIGRAHV